MAVHKVRLSFVVIGGAEDALRYGRMIADKIGEAAEAGHPVAAPRVRLGETETLSDAQEEPQMMDAALETETPVG